MSVNAAQSSGATGASPTPQSGASTGGSPASTSTRSQATSSGTTKKIDIGMGPRHEEPSQASSTSPDMDDDTFWKTHGDRIFKHERFKELNSYKAKYDELAPVTQFMESAGGLEQLQDMHRYFGPVWNSFLKMGDNANQVWSQLYPILQAVAMGQDISPFIAQAQAGAASEPDDIDPWDEKLKPVTTELNQLKENLKQREERDKYEAQQKLVERRQNNFRSYDALFEKTFSDPEHRIPAEFKEDAAELVKNHIWQFMPKLPNGQYLNPLDAFNEQAFRDCWEKVVIPKIRKWTGASLSQAKQETEKGSPVLPDTNAQGSTPSTHQAAYNRKDKMRRLAQGIQNLRI